MAIALFGIILFFVAYEWWDENRGKVNAVLGRVNAALDKFERWVGLRPK